MPNRKAAESWPMGVEEELSSGPLVQLLPKTKVPFVGPALSCDSRYWRRSTPNLRLCLPVILVKLSKIWYMSSGRSMPPVSPSAVKVEKEILGRTLRGAFDER